MTSIALYIHFPFCLSICPYCDFDRQATGFDRIDVYLDAVKQELQCCPRERVHSIFFGGGTPSLLAPEQLAAVLDAARQWPVAPGAEITIEANPDDRGLDYYQAIREAGVNRLSLGVQSFDDAMLHRLGRRHDAAAAVDAARLARAAGFDNLSLDLMFALPGQTLEQWGETVDRALELETEHLSLYNLTIEPDTPFATWHAAGKLVVPDDDAAADMYQLAIERLGRAGYEHYEISNWAKPSYPARHNLRYWRNQPYFGVGAGAHSCFAGHRYANVLAPARYISQTRFGETAVDMIEPIGRELEMGETMMLGLRLAEGVALDRFRQRFGVGLEDVYGGTLAELVELGLLRIDDRRVCLTERGRFLGNEVFCRFLPAAEPAAHEAA